MPKVYSAASNEISSDYLEKFAGPEADFLSGGVMPAGSHITAAWRLAAYTDADRPEDNACMYFIPKGQGRFTLQLCYNIYDRIKQNSFIYSFVFNDEYFTQFPADLYLNTIPFKYTQFTEQEFTLCARSLALLRQFSEPESILPLSTILHYNHCISGLLVRALEHISMPFTVCQVPACRFLANDTERVKIEEAQQFLAERIDRPVTIKELSRKVAMNECYLKKGFKALTGKTIHEYQQELRIARASELLQQKNYSVTDVAALLGYSSISHFSTAYKRVTGIKPCELLK